MIQCDNEGKHYRIKIIRVCKILGAIRYEMSQHLTIVHV